MRHQYSYKKINKSLNPSGSLNAKKLARLTLLTSTGMTMLVHPAYAELIIQNSPVNAQPPVTTINELQTQPTDASLDKLVKVLHIDKQGNRTIKIFRTATFHGKPYFETP